MGKNFILTNDPDHGTLERMKNVFEALDRSNIVVTTAVFCTLENDGSDLASHCYRGETGALDEPEYRDFMLQLRDRGHEIAFHGYSQVSNKREKFEEGLEIYKDIFGEYPFTYMEHGGLPGHHPDSGCKKERLDWMGSKKGSDYYIEDIVRQKVKCVWGHFGLLDGPELWEKNPNKRGDIENLRPKLDSDLFYKKDGVLFFKRWRTHYLRTMSAELKSSKESTFIGYTHFGYDGYARLGVAWDDWRSRESCDNSSALLRRFIDESEMENSTLREHVVRRGIL